MLITPKLFFKVIKYKPTQNHFVRSSTISLKPFSGKDMLIYFYANTRVSNGRAAEEGEINIIHKKHKTNKTCEPNYSNSDSSKRICRHWGRAQVSTTLFSLHSFLLSFACIHSSVLQ